MPAVQRLNQGNNAKRIEQKYIDRVLQEEATNILRAQDRIISRYRATEKVPELGRRRFSVSGGKAEFTHPLRQRFIDMKYRKGVRQKEIPVHNKIVYAHFNNIINKLAFGLTDDVRELIANELDIQL